jgi:23S rRNA (uracil1939-C5)-methyltransferase
VQVGQTFSVNISNFGMAGEGIARHLDFTIFVPHALPNEFVKIKINHVKKSIAFASLVKVINPSPLRRVSPCCSFTNCGGCDLLHVGYDEQLKIKWQNLKTVLQKNAAFCGDIEKIVPSDNEFAYRNKISLPFGFQNGQAVLGFYKQNTHQIIPVKNCVLHGGWASKLIEIILNFVNAQTISVYNEGSKKGLLRHLVARYIGGALSVTLVLSGNKLPHAEKLVELLKANFNNVSLHLSINTKQNNVIMGDKLVPVYAPNQTAEVMGVKVEISPHSFFQVNEYIAEKIYNNILSTVNCQPSTYVDAYAGVGLLGAIILKQNKNAKVVNIEIVKEAVADQNKLYKLNNLSDRATNILGDAATELNKILTDPRCTMHGARCTIILDPPRKGVSENLITTLKTAKNCNPDIQIAYISCNPATLSRDLKLLQPEFKIEKIIPFDMFPQTQHIEVLTYLN